jgi:hypothetical protein
LGRKVIRLLVEVGVLAARRILVVLAQRGHQVALGYPERFLHLLDGLPAVDEPDQRHRRHFRVRLVDDEIGDLIGLLQHERRRA